MAREGFGHRLAAVTATVFLTTAMVSPAAFAQETDPVTGVTDPAPVTGPAAGEVTDPVTEVTDPVTDPVTEITDPVTEITDPVTDPVTEVTDPVTEPVAEVTQPIVDDTEEAVGDTEDKIKDTLNGPVGDVKDAIDDTKNTVEDTTQPVTGTLETTASQLPGLSGDGGNDSGNNFKEEKTKADGSTSLVGHPVAIDPDGRPAGLQRSSAPADGVANRTVVVAPPSGSVADGESLVEQIARVASDAAKRLAFPMALLVAVGGFLVLQGRLDRRDPKLASAPLDGDDEGLSFD